MTNLNLSEFMVWENFVVCDLGQFKRSSHLVVCMAGTQMEFVI